MKNRILVLLVAAVVCAWATSAWALPSTVQAKWTSVVDSGEAYGQWPWAGSNLTLGAGGLFTFERLDGDNSMFYPRTRVGSNGFLAVCMELAESSAKDTAYTFAVKTLEQTPVANFNLGFTANPTGLRKMWATHFDGLDQSDSTQVAAYQAAVWELVYDGTADLTSGTFILDGSSAVVAQANTYLSGWGDKEANLMGLSLDGTQDFVVEVVPESSAIALWGMIGGVFALGCWFRRKRQGV